MADNNLTGYRDNNPLVGYGDDLLGYGDSLIGYPADRGPNYSGTGIGYNGQVHNAVDFGRALLGGVMGVTSPMTGMLNLAAQAINPNPGIPSSMATANLLAQALGLSNPSPSAGAISTDLSSGIGSKDMQVSSSLGEGNDAGGFNGFEGGSNGGSDGMENGKNFEGKAGFASGGYTGNAPPSAAVGPVHGQEFVFSAPAVRAIGLPVLQRLMAASDPHYAAMVRAFGPDEGGVINMLLTPRR